MDCSKTRVKSKPSRHAASTTGPKAASAVGTQRGVEDIFIMGQGQANFIWIQQNGGEDEGKEAIEEMGG